MTWLFIRFYFGVLVVLFLAWFIYGYVLKQRSEADYARVVEEAHGGGVRLLAAELDTLPLLSVETRCLIVCSEHSTTQSK